METAGVGERPPTTPSASRSASAASSAFQQHQGASPLNAVAQCSRCGTLTMMPRCPNCDIPTSVPGGVPEHEDGWDPAFHDGHRRETASRGRGDGTAGVARPLALAPPSTADLHEAQRGRSHHQTNAGSRSPSAATSWSAVPAAGAGETVTGRPVPIARLAPAVGGGGGQRGAPEGIVTSPAPVHRPAANHHAQPGRNAAPGRYGAASATAAPAAGGVLRHTRGEHSADVDADAFATVSELRREVDRLTLALQRREHELQELRVDVNGKAMTKHELQELWRTVNRQNAELDSVRRKEEELLALREKYNSLLAEKDRWMLDSITRQEQAGETMARAAAEADALREELRDMQRRLFDAQEEADEARREARAADQAVHELKATAQRMTNEVLELQQAVTASGEDDHRELQRVRREAGELADEKSRLVAQLAAAESAMRDAEEEAAKLRQHVAALRDDVARQDRNAGDLEARIRLQEIELLAAQDETLQLREALRERAAAAAAAASAPHPSPPTADAGLSPMPPVYPPSMSDAAMSPVAFSPPLASAAATHDTAHLARLEAQLAEALAAVDQLEAADAERAAALRLVEELRTEVARVSDDADQRVEALRREKGTLAEQLAAATGELRALAREATSSTSELAIQKLERRLSESREAEARAKRECEGLQRELDQAREALSEAQLQVSRARQEVEAAGGAAREATAEVERRLRADHERRVAELTTKLDEERATNEAARTRTQNTFEELSRRLDEARRELVTVRSERDQLRFEVDRTKSSSVSPTRLASQREEHFRQVEHVQKLRDDAERRVTEQLSVIESLQRDLTAARTARSNAEALAGERQHALMAACSAVAAAGVEELAPRLRQVLAERDAAVEQRHTAVAALNARVADLEERLLLSQAERDRVASQQASATTRLQQTEHSAELQRAAFEAKLADAAAELERERDWLAKEMEAARVATQREKEEHAASKERHASAVRELEASLREVQAERESLLKTQAMHNREVEKLRSAQHEMQLQLSAARQEVGGLESTVATMDAQLREHLKTIERLKADKARLLADVGAAKSSADADVAELRTRLDDAMARHAKEHETLRASLRVERDKVLREAELRHAAEARASELELQTDALRAERDRAAKELEHTKRASGARIEGLQRALDETTATQEGLRREVEECAARFQAALRDLDAAQHALHECEAQLQDVTRHRDQIAAQIDTFRMERDAAVRTAMEFSNSGSAAAAAHAKQQQQQQQQHQQYHQQQAHVRGYPSSSSYNPNVSEGGPHSSWQHSSYTTSPMLYDRPLPSHHAPHNGAYVARRGESGGDAPSSSSCVAAAAHLPPPTSRGVTGSSGSGSGIGSGAFQVGTPSSSLRTTSSPAPPPPAVESQTARERQEALFTHFREQQHNNSAAMRLVHEANSGSSNGLGALPGTPPPSTAAVAPGRQNSPMGQPLSAYR